MQVRNVDPTGSSREISDHGLIVEHGDTAEVPDEVGEALLAQADVWQPVGEAKKARKAKDEEA
jgi:hypothetical protein